MGILEKISEIEKEIARTQKNKGEMHFRLELGRMASTNFITRLLYFIIEYLYFSYWISSWIIKG